MASGQPVAAGINGVETDLPYTSDGRLVLDIKAAVTDAFLAELGQRGYAVMNADQAAGTIRLASELSAVEPLAELPQVSFVQPRQDAVTSRVGATPTLAERHGRRELL